MARALIPQRRCKKIKYSSYAEAARAAEVVFLLGKTVGRANIYFCSPCGGWHWGHRNKGKILGPRKLDLSSLR